MWSNNVAKENISLFLKKHILNFLRYLKYYALMKAAVENTSTVCDGFVPKLPKVPSAIDKDVALKSSAIPLVWILGNIEKQ